MLLAPTFLLALAIRKSEDLYTGYSKILLGLSLTAPVCLGVFSIPSVNQGTMFPGRDLPGPAVWLAFRDSRVGVQPAASAV